VHVQVAGRAAGRTLTTAVGSGISAGFFSGFGIRIGTAVVVLKSAVGAGFDVRIT
jgi:threonine/homoserine/homoserine lactone efflux protein